MVPGMRPVSITKTGKVRNTHYVYGSGRNSTKARRCGECEGCMREDCGTCKVCTTPNGKAIFHR